MRLHLAVGAFLAVVIACGPAAPASTSAQPASVAPLSLADLVRYEGADRQQILEEGAKKEGTVVWYTSLAGDIIDRHAAAFQAKYPYLKVEIFRGAENELLTKATQEIGAGQPSFDVIESQISAIALLFDAKAMTPYFTPSAAKIGDDFKTKDTGDLIRSATDRISLISFGYNTSLVPEGALPKTMQDLLNPALVGKLQVAGSTTGQRWLGSVLYAMGDDKGKAFLQQLATQQKVKVQQVSGQALLSLIAKGEVPASFSIFKDHVDLAAQQTKAPVKWIPLEPVVGNTGQTGLAAGAQHPHAALLFIDYLLGADGVKVFHDNQYTVATDSFDFKIWVPEKGRTATEIDKDTKAWADLFKSIFR
jgi:iron(III) transport system substrate-binding protein